MAQKVINELSTELAHASPYYLGEDIVDIFPSYFRAHQGDCLYVVTSRELWRRFGPAFGAMLDGSGICHQLLLIDEGEQNKSWCSLSGLCERLVAAGVTKDSVLLALGGGLISNVVGLAAGLIYRGVPFVDVPTTLMAQSDGCLSNKQAVNGAGGKNQFGLYHAPLFIWADVAYLRQEPLRQFRSAIVEGLKNGFINDCQWLDRISRWLERGMDAIHDDLERFTLELVESKLDILRQDPSEVRLGLVLEYGHTFGHAMEWLDMGRLLHGEAVSIGMCIAARLGQALGLLSASDVRLHYRLLGELLEAPVLMPDDLDPQRIYHAMQTDNKRRAGGLRYILLDGVGRPHQTDGDYLVRAPERIVMEVLRESTHVAH